MSNLISVIVPAYNEEQRISKTLRAIDRFFAYERIEREIIVVDDGCKDQTVAVVTGLKIPNLRVVNYGRNRGKGYAIRYGAAQAKGAWVLMTDADNSTPIEEFLKLWLYHDRFSVIIGSRYVRGSNITVKQPTGRIILSRLGNVLVQLLLLPGINDTQCGFKLFSAAAAQKIFAKQTVFGWGFDMEILRIARELRYPIKEVPVTWVNDDQSRIQSARVFSKTLQELLAIKGNSLLGRYRD